MKYKLFLLLGLIFASFSTSAQSTDDILLLLTKATFKAEDSELHLKLKIKNNSDDTITMVKPQFNHFDKNFRATPNIYLGEIEKPYTLHIHTKQECDTVEEEEMMVAMQESPRYLSFLNRDVVKLVPGEESRNYTVILNLFSLVELCESGEFEVSLSYAPKYKILTSEQYNTMKKLKDKLDRIIRDSHQYIEQIGWSNNELRIRHTQVHTHLKDYQLKKALTDLRSASNQIPINFASE